MISLLAPLKRWPRRLTSAISRGPSLRAATRCGPPCSTANTWCSDTTQATLSRGRNFASLSSSRTRFFTYHHRPPPPSVSSGSFGYATSRGFSQSAPGYYARYRYRRFGDNVSGAAGGVGGPSPGGYGGWNRGPGTSLIRLLLESRVVWTVVVVGTGFYIFNLETVKVSPHLGPLLSIRFWSVMAEGRGWVVGERVYRKRVEHASTVSPRMSS